MSASILPVAYANTGYELESMLPDVFRGRPVFRNFVIAAGYYRQLAVGDLLLSADSTGFYEHLFHASRALLHALTEGDEQEFLTSQCAAFLDAVACRDVAGAESMAELAPSEPNLQREYEEDFLYQRTLMDLYLGVEPDELRPRVERYEELAEDQDDYRLPVLAALLDADQEAFDEALADAIEAIREDFAARREDESLHPDEGVTVAHVSVEVLAWIELAHRRGLTVLEEYPLAPSVARAFHLADFPAPDSWKTLTGFAL